jgi:RNA polymerase sigma-70 factor (ECF subfamily)
MDAVYRFAIRLTGDADRASDLTQDTFLRAFQNWDRYTPGTKAKSWLFTICRNLFLRHRERTQRHDEIIAAVADEDPRNISRESTVFLAVEGRDPEGAFWRDVVDEEVLRAIDDLPIEFRQAVVLSDLEDLSYAEIAAVLDVPVGTVKSRLFRGRRILQSQLYKYALSEGIIEAKSPATVGRETRERNQ